MNAERKTKFRELKIERTTFDNFVGKNDLTEFAVLKSQDVEYSIHQRQTHGVHRIHIHFLDY